jgi:glycosyltransferase involved in cell wall biosynthesis
VLQIQAMYRDKKVCVVVPAYNEETQIGKVINTMPPYVDSIVIVNDCSKDKTEEAVKAINNSKVILINHKKNQGVGGAIATGYIWARDNEMDATVVMAGDAQMDPNDLPNILNPVVSGEVDYSKGNRLFTGEAYKKIPKVRYLGNSVLSFLTKIASGYWHVADSQTGYTAISLKALKLINWNKMYKRYGQPNDLLVRLNVYDLKVRDIPVKPVYGVGEKSGIKIRKVIFTIPWLLFKLFLWRMKEKYIIRNFHPLVFFYFLGAFFTLITILLFARLFVYWYIVGNIPQINALAAMFSFMSASFFTLFAMWFDMESNKDLK